MGDSNVPNVPMDPNLGSVQNAAFQGAQALGQYTPQTQAIYYNQANNPFAPAAVGAAQQGGAATTAQGQQNINTSNAFAGVPSQLQPYITQTLQTAYDPQNALKAQLEQQSADTTNADLASRGLQYSPYGAGVASTADQLFQTNWLNTLLGREQTGAQTASTLLGAGVNTANAGAALGSQGANQLVTGGALPYATTTAMNQDLASVIPYLTSNQQQQLQDYLSYYNAANTNTANAVNAGAAQDKADQALGTGIGSLLGQLFQGAGTKALF